MHQHLILVCDITVTKSLSVRLTVTRNAIEADVWVWTYILHSGESIANGTAETRLAGQVAAQRAHESWLHMNRKRLSIPARVPYHWEVVE
jgi:hypothetical protein